MHLRFAQAYFLKVLHNLRESFTLSHDNILNRL